MDCRVLKAGWLAIYLLFILYIFPIYAFAEESLHIVYECGDFSSTTTETFEGEFELTSAIKPPDITMPGDYLAGLELLEFRPPSTEGKITMHYLISISAILSSEGIVNICKNDFIVWATDNIRLLMESSSIENTPEDCALITYADKKLSMRVHDNGTVTDNFSSCGISFEIRSTPPVGPPCGKYDCNIDAP